MFIEMPMVGIYDLGFPIYDPQMTWADLAEQLERWSAELQIEMPVEWRGANGWQQYEMIIAAELAAAADIRNAIRVLALQGELPGLPDMQRVFLSARLQSAIGFCHYCWMNRKPFPEGALQSLIATLLETHWNKAGRQQWQTLLREALSRSGENLP